MASSLRRLVLLVVALGVATALLVGAMSMLAPTSPANASPVLQVDQAGARPGRGAGPGRAGAAGGAAAGPPRPRLLPPPARVLLAVTAAHPPASRRSCWGSRISTARPATRM